MTNWSPLLVDASCSVVDAAADLLARPDVDQWHDVLVDVGDGLRVVCAAHTSGCFKACGTDSGSSLERSAQLNGWHASRIGLCRGRLVMPGSRAGAG